MRLMIQMDGGTIESTETRLTAQSGWSLEDKVLFARRNIPVRNGEISNEDGKLILFCESDKLSIFQNLCLQHSWIGKTVSKVISLTDSRIILAPGGSLYESDYLYAFVFSDSSRSEFFTEAKAVTSVFDDSLSTNRLAEIGMLSDSDLFEKEEEENFFRGLNTERNELTEERSQAQKSLANARFSKRRQLYRDITTYEKRLSEIQIEEKRQSKWYARSFNSEYLPNFVSGLVDLFSYRTRKNLFGKKVDGLVSPEGKIVEEVLIIKEPSENDNHSKQAHVIRFSDGSFSVPYGICAELSLEIPVDGLLQLGFITNTSLNEALAKLKTAKSEHKSKQADQKRLSNLREELKQFNLGENRTLRIIQEIAVLES